MMRLVQSCGSGSELNFPSRSDYAFRTGSVAEPELVRTGTFWLELVLRSGSWFHLR